MQLVTVHRAQMVQMLFIITYDAADERQSAPIYSTLIHDQLSLLVSTLFLITIYILLQALGSSFSYEEIIYNNWNWPFYLTRNLPLVMSSLKLSFDMHFLFYTLRMVA